MPSASDADIEELKESSRALIEATYSMLERIDRIVKRFEFLDDPRYKTFDHNRR